MSEITKPVAGTSTVTETEETSEASPNVVLKLRKPKTNRKVKWTEGTVDNEFMNKKKSKCCCIYEKPRMFGESSSEDSDDDGCSPHCQGHKKKCHQHGPAGGGASGSEGASGGTSAPS